MPAAGTALVIGMATVAVVNPAASVMNAHYEKDREALMGDILARAGKDIWIRQGDAHTQIVIHALSQSHVQSVLRLKRVSLFVSTPNRTQGLQFSRRIEAAEALLMPGYWRLIGAREATPGGEALSYDSLSIPSSLNAGAAMERFAPPKAVPFWALARAITATEQAGFSATGYRLELQRELARPLMFAAMSILAAAFSLRLVRLGGLAAMAGSGVALGFILFFLDEFCGALGIAGAIPPFAAAWTPPLLALLSGVTLLCYTEDG